MEKKGLNKKLIWAVLILMIIFSVILSSKNSKDKKIENNTNNTEQNNSEILGNKEDLISFSIQPFAKVKGVVSYRGVIKGAYFFEANILINVLDTDKNVLKRSNAVATSDWMTSEPVSFEGNIDFSLFPKGKAYVEIHNDNASGLPENDKSILIPIIIN